MSAWAGMERFLHLSMGSQVGASGVALIAVLELKRMLQYPTGAQGQSESSACIVRLTAEEWRTVAGIHVRKTFERVKARLEELGVLKIERNGRLLEITLWPEVIKAEEENETSCETGFETKLGTTCGTELGTCKGTCCGTSGGTGLELGTRSETVTVSLRERVLRTREDVVFPSPDVPENVISVRDNALLRYPLNRHYNNSDNDNNEATKNDQRYNERPDEKENWLSPSSRRRRKSLVGENQVAVPPSEGEHLLEFAILWVQEAGHPLSPYEKEGLVRFLRLGYTEELFVEALRFAVAADNRRMGYVLGILRNWYQEGVRCLQDVAESKKRWDDLRFLKRAKSCVV